MSAMFSDHLISSGTKTYSQPNKFEFEFSDHLISSGTKTLCANRSFPLMFSDHLISSGTKTYKDYDGWKNSFLIT